MAATAKSNRAYDLAYYGDDFTGSTDVLDVLERAGIPTVLLLTDPTPGLPYIAAAGTDVARHAAAVAEGLGGLDGGVRERLGIAGLVRVEEVDYGVIGRRLAAALERVGA